MIDLKEFVKLYDSFAWLPTIRGALSLDLVENSKNVLGDVDKFVAKFKRYKEVHSEHYLATTSLLTFNDSKFSSDYARTFRFIFVASINNSERTNAFLSDNNLNGSEYAEYFSNEGVLLGRLTIITELTNSLTNSEIKLLKLIKSLDCQSEEFRKEFYIEASSMEVLETKRDLMFRTWLEIEEVLKDIETVDENRPTYCFDVFLTRDGILLMRDSTKIEYKKSYAPNGTCSDYKQNIPLHRLFKVAMNYVKYLFHANYHHNEEHDTYLPASNINPYRILNDNDLKRIFRHQLNAFLTPIMKLKRCNFKDYPIDANGIIIYARAFINVFKYNSLIDENYANKAEDFLKIQESEINHLLNPKKNILNSLLAQDNFLFIFTGILAFVVAISTITSIFVDIRKINPELRLFDNKFIIEYISFVLGLVFIGFSLYIIPHKIISKNQFKRRKVHKNILYVDSNLNKSKLSLWYRLYIFLKGVCFISRKKIYYTIKLVLAVTILIFTLLLGYSIVK